MKKIISMLLALMLICAFCTPAFAADDEPVEYVPDGYISIYGGNYIISSGDYKVEMFSVEYGATLTIGKDARITVTGNYENGGTINVLGTLDITGSKSIMYNYGTIRIANCSSGQVLSNIKLTKNLPKNVDHIYQDGACIGCGHKCPNEFHNGKYICPDCGMVVETAATGTGSVLSNGSFEIVYGIACLAAGMAVMFFIMKKKIKPAAAEGAVSDDEE